jgi:hypothetical protein
MIAFVILVFAIAFLAIGWLMTGKTKLEKACGRNPTQKKDTSCGSTYSCELCSDPNEKRTLQDEGEILQDEEEIEEEKDQNHNSLPK